MPVLADLSDGYLAYAQLIFHVRVLSAFTAHIQQLLVIDHCCLVELTFQNGGVWFRELIAWNTAIYNR